MASPEKPNAIRVLIVEDETPFRELLTSRFNRKGSIAIAAATGSEALSAARQQPFDIALVDIRLSDTDGISLLKQLKELQPDAEIVMMTGHGTIETAVESIRQGAYHYLTKPLDLKELEIMVAKAWEKQQMTRRLAGLNTVLDRQAAEPVIVGASPRIQELLSLTRKAANWDMPVLITGESGTGKELIARALHRWGPRAGKPWIAVNCGALPTHLLESELFGHEKGAFSGAVSARMGLAEAAHKGSLFLDEVGDLDPALQTKLLRFLESGEYRRLGSNSLHYADVRCISATNRDLEQAVKKGLFRSDLYYRLSGMVLHVPPLRERPEDIPLLAEYFVRRRYPHSPPQIGDDAKDRLVRYMFPGNVRELSYMIDRACLLSGGEELTWRHFSVGCPEAALSAAVADRDDFLYPPGMPLEDVKKQHVLATLNSLDGNRSLAAQRLGIGVRSLYRYLEEWGIKE